MKSILQFIISLSLKLKLLLVIAVVLPIAIIVTSFKGSEHGFEISKNLEIFSDVYKNLHLQYVDEVDPAKIMKTAIDEMLTALDPYTNYITEAELEDYQFMTTGQYGGIGALIHQRDDFVIISEPYENFPAEKSGLRAGDVILKVDGKSVKGKSVSELSELLKGQSGTEISMEVKRGENDIFNLNLKREEIKIDNIPFYDVLQDSIGYIKLTGFTKNAANEVKNAFLTLKKDHSLHSVIIDLRGNGGGLLNEAVDICNIFVEKGNLIVSTKGKNPDKNNFYSTRSNASDSQIPLLILVNSTSASASEIVAGAIQDLDRGLILGQRTFGKGLVQNIIPLSYNTKMKITVAKYYIPSGRCIQAIDYSHRNDDGSVGKIPDSLMNEFKTNNGRIVYDGGGVFPDVFLEKRKLSDISASLITKFLIFDFATKYRNENDKIPPIDDFEITQDIYDQFVNYISDKDYDYTTDSEKKLENFKIAAQKEGYFDNISDEFLSLSKKVKHNKEKDLITHKKQIMNLLKEEIAARYYHQKGRIKASLENDPEVEEAIALLLDQERYHNLLQTGNDK